MSEVKRRGPGSSSLDEAFRTMGLCKRSHGWTWTGRSTVVGVRDGAKPFEQVVLWPPGLELLFQNFPHSPRVDMSWSHSAHLEHLL